ncbi:MAG: hypothetical protein LBD22_00140 [Spirochaetaceae bacterium]|jgi:tetratricopeptide (TPR) repeat protein|nr:hypothetical protein [Spirochaetaceae bacterium]
MERRDRHAQACPKNHARQFRCVLTVMLYCAAGRLWAQNEPPNAHLADNYMSYLPTVLKEGGLEAAEQYLLRAADYTSVSSDLSYELARVRDELKRPRRLSLEALEHALSTNRWKSHTVEEARLFRGRLFYELKDYYQALSELDRTPESAERERLALAALLALRRDGQFRARAQHALSRYPLDTALIVLLYKYAALIEQPDKADRELIDTITRRVVSSGAGGQMLFHAASFISDEAQARRLLQAALARHPGLPPADALPVLLNLGVLDEETAISVLFDETHGRKLDSAPISVALLQAVYALLRTMGARDYFLGRLGAFTGVIGEDSNNDAIFESFAAYKNGILVSWMNDSAQERETTLELQCAAGEPVSVRLRAFEGPPYQIVYESYPAVKTVVQGAQVYYFIPDSFFFSPVVFEPVCDDTGIRFPRRNTGETLLTDRTLFSFATIIERPSREFTGAVEELHLFDGIISFSVEKFQGALVSETVYQNGIPLYQRVDVELDGRLETIRHFVQNETGELEIGYIEIDSNGNGVYEKE